MSTPFKDHFSKQAALYAESRPHYPEELFAWVAGQCQAHELAWDCATGNGQAAISLVHYFHEVIATDASEAQIKNAIPHGRISYRVAKAENSGLPDACADIVTVATALHWFDFDAFYAEAKRVLKPGGLLACWSYGWQYITPEIDKIVQYYGLDLIKKYWPPERDHIDTEYKHIPFLSPEIEAPMFYCIENWTMHQYLAYIMSWSGTQRYLNTHGSNPLDLVMHDLTRAWGNPDEVREIKWPVYMKAWRKP
jgi:ubiquinone/menaquinone biosynthesis C-methylase UbiE